MNLRTRTIGSATGRTASFSAPRKPVRVAGKPIALELAADDSREMNNVLLPNAHASAEHDVIRGSVALDHPGRVPGEGRGMQRRGRGENRRLERRERRGSRTSPARSGSDVGANSVSMHLMTGPDEVASQLNLLARKTASEVEVGVDEGDAHGSSLAPMAD